MECGKQSICLLRFADRDADVIIQPGLVEVADEDAVPCGQVRFELGGIAANDPTQDEVGVRWVGREPVDGRKRVKQALTFGHQLGDGFGQVDGVFQRGERSGTGRYIDIVGLFGFPQGRHQPGRKGSVADT